MLSDEVSAAQFGASPDIADNGPALQAAFDYCFGPVSNPNGIGNASKNIGLFIPKGNYRIATGPIRVAKLVGGKVRGAGRFVTTLTDTSGAGVFATNGCSSSVFSDMFIAGVSGVSILFDLDWDNSGGGNALQSNTFSNIRFNTAKVGLRIGFSTFMGSENLISNCFIGDCTDYGVATLCFNALQNTLVGGNIAGCGVGVYMLRGTVCAYSTGFQLNGWDFQQINSANATVLVCGCRTESANFWQGGNGMGLALIAVSQRNDTAGTFVSHSGPVSIASCHSDNGVLGGNINGLISSTSFGREDWIGTAPKYSIQTINITTPLTREIKNYHVATPSFFAPQSDIISLLQADGTRVDLTGEKLTQLLALLPP